MTAPNLTPGNPDGVVKWTDAQRSQILSELIAGFPDVPHDKFLRFRSSSNAEDSQELTGAG